MMYKIRMLSYLLFIVDGSFLPGTASTNQEKKMITEQESPSSFLIKAKLFLVNPINKPGNYKIDSNKQTIQFKLLFKMAIETILLFR